MNKLLTIPRFWGPLATVLLTVLYHLGSFYFGYTVSLAWIYLPVIAASFIGGFRAGLISAVFMCLYAVYVVPQFDRVIQIIVSVPLVAGLVGWQTRQLRQALANAQAALVLAQANQAKADLVDSANGNIEKLKLTLKMIDDLLMGWDVLENNSRRGLIIDIRTHLATLTLLVYGWHKLAQEKKSVEDG